MIPNNNLFLFEISSIFLFNLTSFWQIDFNNLRMTYHNPYKKLKINFVPIMYEELSNKYTYSLDKQDTETFYLGRLAR